MLGTIDQGFQPVGRGPPRGAPATCQGGREHQLIRDIALKIYEYELSNL